MPTKIFVGTFHDLATFNLRPKSHRRRWVEQWGSQAFHHRFSRFPRDFSTSKIGSFLKIDPSNPVRLDRWTVDGNVRCRFLKPLLGSERIQRLGRGRRPPWLWRLGEDSCFSWSLLYGLRPGNGGVELGKIAAVIAVRFLWFFWEQCHTLGFTQYIFDLIRESTTVHHSFGSPWLGMVGVWQHHGHSYTASQRRQGLQRGARGARKRLQSGNFPLALLTVGQWRFIQHSPWKEKDMGCDC